MATVVNPDNGEYIILGNLTADGISSSDGDLDLGKVRIDNTDDINLNSIPANYADADVALNVAGGCYVAGNSYVGGTFVANGDVVTLGNASGSLTLGANITSDIIPGTTNTFDIGSATATWAGTYTDNVYFDQTPDVLNPGGILSVTSGVSQIGTNTSATQTLPDGSANGQLKVIFAASNPTTPVTVTPTTALGYTSITFNNEGDSATLTWRNGWGWVVLSSFRSSIS